MSTINNPERAGHVASGYLTFGRHSRYAVMSVHTRFDAIEWFVKDSEKIDEYGMSSIIRQCPTLTEAIAGLETADDYKA